MGQGSTDGRAALGYLGSSFVDLLETDGHSFDLFLAPLLLAGGQKCEPPVTAQSLPPQIFSRIFW